MAVGVAPGSTVIGTTTIGVTSMGVTSVGLSSGMGVPVVGVGVKVGVGVSGIGITERGSTPGGTTITPGVPPTGGVTTTTPWIKFGVGVKVGAAMRVGGGVGVGRAKRSPAAQPRVAKSRNQSAIHGGLIDVVMAEGCRGWAGWCSGLGWLARNAHHSDEAVA
jgi:hypothetical protein